LATQLFATFSLATEAVFAKLSFVDVVVLVTVDDTQYHPSWHTLKKTNKTKEQTTRFSSLSPFRRSESGPGPIYKGVSVPSCLSYSLAASGRIPVFRYTLLSQVKSGTPASVQWVCHNSAQPQAQMNTFITALRIGCRKKSDHCDWWREDRGNRVVSPDRVCVMSPSHNIIYCWRDSISKIGELSAPQVFCSHGNLRWAAHAPWKRLERLEPWSMWRLCAIINVPDGDNRSINLPNYLPKQERAASATNFTD